MSCKISVVVTEKDFFLLDIKCNLYNLYTIGIRGEIQNY